MYKFRVGIFFVISVLSAVYGTDISFSGVVRNTGNAPIKGVTVKLQNAGSITTTDLNGRFKISGTTTGVSRSGIHPIRNSFSISNRGILTFAITNENTPVLIRILDIQGKVITTPISDVYKNGIALYDIPAAKLPDGKLYILEIRMGEVESHYKCIVAGRHTFVKLHSEILPTSLKKSAVTVFDTLLFTKTGYDTIRQLITEINKAPQDTTVVSRSKTSSNISICGALGTRSLAKKATSAPQGNCILAVPSIRGNIDIKEMNCMKSALWLPADSNGTFNVELPKQIWIPWPTEALGDVEWILALIDTTKKTRLEQFISFISISDPSGTLLRIPADNAVNDIGLGTLEHKGDELQSTMDLSDNAQNFSLSMDQLRDIARTDNAAKMVKNAFVNYNRADGRYYVADPTFCIGSDSLGLIYNRYPEPSEFFQKPRVSLSVQIDTYDSSLFNVAAICNRSQTIDLYPPAPIHAASITKYIPGDTSWYTAYFPVCISSDTALNRSQNQGNNRYVDPSVLPGCNSSWNKSISFYVGSLVGAFDAGAWVYKKNRDSVFATYDFGLTLPFDSAGIPFVYIPSIKLVVDTATGVLDSIATKWFEYSKRESKFTVVTDLTAIKGSVSSFIINPYDDNGPPHSINYGNFDTLSFSMHQKFPAETLYVSNSRPKHIKGITVQFVTCGVHISEDWRIGF